MANHRRERAGPSRFCRTLCVWCATWALVAATFSQPATEAAATAEEMKAAGSLAIIPSAPRTSLIPSTPRSSSRIPSGVIPSAPSTPEGPSLVSPTTIYSNERSSISIIPTPTPTTPSPTRTAPIPSASVSSPTQSTTLSTSLSLTVPFPTPSNGTTTGSANATLPLEPPNQTTTTEDLRPIPAPSISPGDPDGHHEIPEPNFSTTLPCLGCSPIIEIPATGWETVPSFPISIPPAQEQETKGVGNPPVVTPVVTLSAGPSNVLIKPDLSEGHFIIGDETAVKPGQTVTVGGTPVAVHTSRGRTDMVIGGTKTMPFAAPTRGGPAAIATLGSSAITIEPAPAGGNFIITYPSDDEDLTTTVSLGQTLTISSTQLVLQTSGSRTQLVLDGTQTIPLALPDAHITDAPILLPIVLVPGQTLTPIPRSSNADPTPQPIGYILPPATLFPASPAQTLSSTTFSLLAPTVLLINGRTTTLTPSYGMLQTTISAAPLTLWGTTYTANRAGWYVLAPGTTLLPGGAAVTVNGEMVSLEAAGMAVVVQGSTSSMAPVTAVVTVPRGTGTAPGAGAGGDAKAALSTVGKEHGSGGEVMVVGGVIFMVVGAVGWLSVWL